VPGVGKIYLDRVALVFTVRPGPNTLRGSVHTNRTYAALTLEQLCRLYWNTTGLELRPHDYNSAIQACRSLVRGIPCAS